MLLQTGASICISLDLSTLSSHRHPTQGGDSHCCYMAEPGPGPYFRKQHL